MDTKDTASMVADIATALVTARATLDKWKAYCAARIRVCEVTGCWVWTGSYRNASKRHGGQPRPVISTGGKHVYAYRMVWALKHAQPFPIDMMALHRCDRPECVNPDHVRPGTAKDNANDAAMRGRIKSRLTDQQVHTILTTSARLGPAATPSEIAAGTGDPSIKRWNVRDVARGFGVRRLSARTTDAMTANYALGT